MTDYKITDRPVAGEVQQNTRSDLPQIGPQEFLDRIDAVFAFPQVESIQWQEYTPYFNDGEECIFGIQEVRVRITGTSDDAGDYEDGYLDAWSLSYSGYEETIAPLREAGVNIEGIKASLSALGSSDWEQVARENFGDHAEVTATREGFNVEYYEHE